EASEASSRLSVFGRPAQGAKPLPYPPPWLPRAHGCAHCTFREVARVSRRRATAFTNPGCRRIVETMGAHRSVAKILLLALATTGLCVTAAGPAAAQTDEERAAARTAANDGARALTEGR